MGSDWKLSREDVSLVVVDFQEKLAKVMKYKDKVASNINLLVAASRMMDIPIVATEQYPDGLGPTVPEIRENLPGGELIPKMTFSCWGVEPFHERLKGAGRNTLLVTGMETHVCVYQSVVEALDRGYRVFIPEDAVCSRRTGDWKRGLKMMASAGAYITCTEAVVFDLMERADTPEFKELIKLIK
jgi:nicotinamidase-related amidase